MRTDISASSGTPRTQLAGQRFGLYTAVSYFGEGKWICQCDCGKKSNVVTSNLLRGQSKSCGCRKPEVSRQNMLRHGLADSRIHRSWMSMRQRCLNQNDRAYKNYGGRGIGISDRWLAFENFAQDMGSMPDGYELDRINVNGNYEPTNCRWANPKTQANNKRNNRILEIDGISKTLTQWCESTGITKSAAQKRLALGWSVEKTFATSVRGQRGLFDGR